MNPYTSTDPWWHQTNDFYQQLESEFGFPLASINESHLSDLYASFDNYSDPTTPSGSDTSHRPSIDSSGSSLGSSFGPVKTVNVERIEVYPSALSVFSI
jgi:hypothetical protein